MNVLYERYIRRQTIARTIKHWKRLEKARNMIEILKEGHYCDSCPLCFIYLNKPKFTKCKSCPIRLKTGDTHCQGTPWRVVNHYYKEMINYDNHVFQFNRAATRMRIFLEGLL